MNPLGRKYPTGKNPEILYKQVFYTVKPLIKKQKKGLLSSVVHIILKPDESQAKYLCEYFNIDSKSSLEDDLSIFLDIIGLSQINQIDESFWKNPIRPLQDFF